MSRTTARAGATADEVLPTLVAAGVAAADALLGSTTGQVTVRRVAARLTANAVAATGELPAGLGVAGDRDGRCTLLATPGGTDDPARAATVTAAAITTSQCDEGLREARGHPGLHAYAAGLAAAEAGDCSLRVFLRALAVGWEVGARLGLLFGPPRPGVHPHGGWGAAVAAAAAGAVVDLDTTGLTDAVNLALTVALAGPDASTRSGRPGHHLLPAFGTANGLRTAYLVRDGFPATDPAATHFGRTAHQAGPVPSAVLSARPLLPAAYFKPVGVCAHTLTSWTVARGMDVPAADVTEVTVHAYAAAALLDQRRPANRLARQFSIPWVVACGLVGRDPGAPPAPGRSRDASQTLVARLAERVTVRHDPRLDDGYPAGRPVVVEVTTRAGTRRTGQARFHPGDRENPLSPDEQAAVDAELLRAPGAASRVTGATTLLRELARAPGATPLRQLTRLVRADPPPAAATPDTSRAHGKDMPSW